MGADKAVPSHRRIQVQRSLRQAVRFLTFAFVIRLMLFDIDGTLVRTGGAGVRAFEQTFATAFQISRATEGLNFAGRTDSSLVRQCFQRHQIEPNADNFQRFFDTYVFWLERGLVELQGNICPGVCELIDNLQSLHRPPLLGLLTGNIRLGAEIKLRHFDLWDRFQSGAFGDDHEDRNQLARIARERARQLLDDPLENDEILVIGDTPLDIECARMIDAKVLAVGTGGYSAVQLRAYEPTWSVEDLRRVTARGLCG